MKEKLKNIFDKNKTKDEAYQVLWTKKFQNNFYDNLIDNQSSKHINL